MYVYKTYNPSEPVRKVRYWATKESRQDYLRYRGCRHSTLPEQAY
jgi:hypothetical protein